ncbi:hypothetical protein OJAV_G00230870 [Oryzias javanicus]|uniref:Ig-like domain-containing protein n=1 Tax=Oryzias javanicus TaxID=123683 RepID=A0A3S2LKQ5_ORYJA|nr:hypothetical protein OJAV_G00230870 [Oryzias javanicus]
MILQLEFIIIFMLLFQDVTCENGEELYKRVGEDVLLHCNDDASSNQCSDGTWLYNRRQNTVTEQISDGRNIVQSLARASRLSVSSDCSLTIRNLTDEDAGQYVCQHRNGHKIYVYLKSMSVSSSSPDVSGKVNLTCSVKYFHKPHGCEENSIIWMNETGSRLSGEDVGFELIRGQTNCVSVLTVKHQSRNDKKFTCKFLEDKKVKMDADYILSGISRQTEHLYQRVGEDVLLPSYVDASSNNCSNVTWMYNRGSFSEKEILSTGQNIDQSSFGASRLSVSSNCSLLIRNVTDEDAGSFTFLFQNRNVSMLLTTLDISSSSSDVSGRVDLICSVKYFHKPHGCEENSIIWVDETGSQLTGKGVGFEFRGQTNCVSILTLKHQTGNDKKFTCKFLEDDKVKIDAVYFANVSDFTGLIIIFAGAAVKLLTFLAVIVALTCMDVRRTAKPNEDQKTGTVKTIEDIYENIK